jgi:RNA polymerase sigma-70 factor, ECF subfamily
MDARLALGMDAVALRHCGLKSSCCPGGWQPERGKTASTMRCDITQMGAPGTHGAKVASNRLNAHPKPVTVKSERFDWELMGESLIQLGITQHAVIDSAAQPGAAVLDDERLLEGLRASSDAAYEELLARFQQPVYNIVYRMLNDPNDTNDVVQEVFFKVFRRVRSFRGDSTLKTWIYRIAVNEACNRRRYFQRHLRLEVEMDRESENGWTLQETIATDDRSPYEQMLNHERHELLEQALAGINPVYRAALVLREIEELSYEEIADILQVALGTVKSRILRGREALRVEYLRVSEEPATLPLSPQTAE